MNISKYEIYLDFDLNTNTYEGYEKISILEVNEPLILNVHQLNIKRVLFDNQQVKFKINETAEKMEIDKKVNGTGVVELQFSGKIQEALFGLYLAKSKDTAMITTQFEPVGARWVFPCIDHPAYKSRFALTVAIDTDLNAISNMPAKTIKYQHGKKIIEFEETPTMSTYLLYLGIGKFDEKTEKFEDKKIIIAALKGHLPQSSFPVEVAKNSLKFYEQYFGINYPLPKLHLIAVPDFAAGAMENWGAITFRELALYIDKSTSNNVKKLIAMIEAHEIAHQWFGNLVTMRWWNDLWLNESFATLMGYKTIAQYYPEFEMWSEFISTEMANGLKGDALKSTHPISVDVKDPKDIVQIFDEISYSKGGSILKMLESYLGTDVFRAGIHAYLDKFAYANAESADLWNALESVANQKISTIMKIWIDRPGYPVIYAVKHNNKIRIEQHRFFLDGSENDELWPVPLTIKRYNSIERVLFDSTTMIINANEFVKFNIDQTGFYRVMYDQSLFNNIITHKDHLSNLDIWGIVNDLFAFLMAGKITVTSYLEKIGNFTQHTDYLIVKELATQLHTLILIVPTNKRLVNLAKDYYKQHLTRLGTKKPNEKENDTILRGNLAQKLCIIDNMYAEQLALTFAQFETTDPDMRTAVALSKSIVTNSIKPLLEKFELLTNDEDKTKLIHAMGWLRAREDLHTVLSLIKSGKIKKQDIIQFYLSAAQCPYNRDFIYTMLESAVTEINKIFAGMGTAGRMLESIVPLVGLGRKAEIKEKLSKLKLPEISRGVSKGLELLEIYERLMQKLQ